MSRPADDAFVFNIVSTRSGFEYLRYFVASQLVQSGARFRFVTNDCPPDQIELMQRFVSAYPDRALEVFVVTTDEMIPHGAALDIVRAERDDGDFFCFIDPDIKARAPFLAEFTERLDSGCAGVTSGRGVWCDDDVLPPGHPGVPGEAFYSQDGFLFGSPHFAMYRREPLDATTERWGVGFASRGPDLEDATAARLKEAGHDYWLYDTAKIVNILLQADGNTLCHYEHPQLIHIGGMSHYLASPKHIHDVEARFEVAHFTASVLRDLCEGRPAAAPPEDLDPSMHERLGMVRTELIDLVEGYDGYIRDIGD